MFVPVRLPRAVVLGLTLTFLSWALSSPAASQDGLDDSLAGEAEDVDTLDLARLTAEELEALRLGASSDLLADPWRDGSSSVEISAPPAALNLSAQEEEMVRIGLEAEAGWGRRQTAGLAMASSVNREVVIRSRLQNLVVSAFVNGESAELDRLAGNNARLYIDVPVAVATETVTDTRQRVFGIAADRTETVAERTKQHDQLLEEEREQSYVVEESFELDLAARRQAFAHPREIRRRYDQVLTISGEAPETVVVGGFRVSPEIAGPLSDMLAAAAEDEIIFGGWGYRSTVDQIRLRTNHCGRSGYSIFDGPSPACSPPTARPLHSQHERGLAIDFTQEGGTLNSASPGFLWLQENASTYGFFNLPSEPWHWSTTGH